MSPQFESACCKLIFYGIWYNMNQWKLNESAVIATYLVNKYGKDSKLLGDSAETRAKVEEMLAREPDLASCVFPVVVSKTKKSDN